MKYSNTIQVIVICNLYVLCITIWTICTKKIKRQFNWCYVYFNRFVMWWNLMINWFGGWQLYRIVVEAIVYFKYHMSVKPWLLHNEIFFGNLDLIMTRFFLSSPLCKDSRVFQSVNDDIKALTPNVWQTSIHCYELHEISL